MVKFGKEREETKEKEKAEPMTPAKPELKGLTYFEDGIFLDSEGKVYTLEVGLDNARYLKAQ